MLGIGRMLINNKKYFEFRDKFKVFFYSKIAKIAVKLNLLLKIP